MSATTCGGAETHNADLLLEGFQAAFTEGREGRVVPCPYEEGTPAAEAWNAGRNGVYRMTHGSVPPKKNKGGRPRLRPDQKLHQFSIRFPADIKAALHDIAEIRGESLSTALLWCVEYAKASIPDAQWEALEVIRKARKPT